MDNGGRFPACQRNKRYPVVIIFLDLGVKSPHDARMTLLADITAFCATHDLKEHQFGVLALNDKNFIPQVRGDGDKRPRRVWPETEAKVRNFMATYKAERAA